MSPKYNVGDVLTWTDNNDLAVIKAIKDRKYHIYDIKRSDGTVQTPDHVCLHSALELGVSRGWIRHTPGTKLAKALK